MQTRDEESLSIIELNQWLTSINWSSLNEKLLAIIINLASRRTSRARNSSPTSKARSVIVLLSIIMISVPIMEFYDEKKEADSFLTW